MAKKLGIDKHVIRNYLGIIYDKIGLRNRVELRLRYEARVHEERSHGDCISPAHRNSGGAMSQTPSASGHRARLERNSPVSLLVDKHMAEVECHIPDGLCLSLNLDLVHDPSMACIRLCDTEGEVALVFRIHRPCERH